MATCGSPRKTPAFHNSSAARTAMMNNEIGLNVRCRGRFETVREPAAVGVSAEMDMKASLRRERASPRLRDDDFGLAIRRCSECYRGSDTRTTFFAELSLIKIVAVL